MERLIRRICDRFPKGGQIIADVAGKKKMLATQQYRAEEIHRMGAVMRVVGGRCRGGDGGAASEVEAEGSDPTVAEEGELYP